MLKNSKITIYHKTINKELRQEQYTRTIYDGWYFSSTNASINKGYTDTDNVNVRIELNDVDVNDISIGDIVVKGEVNNDISMQKDLSMYNTHNITSISINDFGTTPHIHIKAE